MVLFDGPAISKLPGFSLATARMGSLLLAVTGWRDSHSFSRGIARTGFLFILLHAWIWGTFTYSLSLVLVFVIIADDGGRCFVETCLHDTTNYILG